ncbi:toxin-antitoxin system, toxin component family protein [Streptomyces sp. NPDC096152]|uniref:toxin-antitoxin system, toxin component family protein n=1 Tax=Streptomyces sp. NPDC096152 TaxID=3366078 RepID=UPI00381112F1
MAFAGARGTAARLAGALRRRRSVRAREASGMRALTAHLVTALGARPHPPAGVRELCHALCEEMAARRGGRPVELRFERIPDDIEVTGLWVEFQEFDLVIVEERAEAVQQLVILGHELWHLHAGHRHLHPTRAAAARALAGEPGGRGPGLWPRLSAAVEQGGTPVAARDGSRERDEAEADDFGHRLATAFRPHLTAPDTGRPLDPLQRTLGYRGRPAGGRGIGGAGLGTGGGRGGDAVLETGGGRGGDPR